MTDSSERDVTCPVCRRHSRADALAAQGVVLSGVEAILTGNNAQVEAVNKSMTRYIGHSAVSLYAQLIEDIADYMNVDVDALLAQYRRAINDEIEKEATKAADS